MKTIDCMVRLSTQLSTHDRGQEYTYLFILPKSGAHDVTQQQVCLAYQVAAVSEYFGRK